MPKDELAIPRKPNIILWDIETSHNITATFGTFKVNIPHQNILQEWYIISVAWKVLGEKKVHALSVADFKGFKKDPNDDLKLVKAVYEVLSKADALIHHYGDRFDIRKFNARLAYHKLPPLPKITMIDTCKIAKRAFYFNYNNLDYLGNYLGVGRKIKNEPGLWLKCLDGDEEAIKKMVKYNKQDVQLLEAVYLKLRPYVPANLNINMYTQTDLNCPTCGSVEMQRRGFHRNKVTKMQRFHCQGCGAWSTKPVNSVAR